MSDSEIANLLKQNTRLRLAFGRFAYDTGEAEGTWFTRDEDVVSLAKECVAEYRATRARKK